MEQAAARVFRRSGGRLKGCLVCLLLGIWPGRESGGVGWTFILETPTELEFRLLASDWPP